MAVKGIKQLKVSSNYLWRLQRVTDQEKIELSNIIFDTINEANPFGPGIIRPDLKTMYIKMNSKFDRRFFRSLNSLYFTKIINQQNFNVLLNPFTADEIRSIGNGIGIGFNNSFPQNDSLVTRVLSQKMEAIQSNEINKTVTINDTEKKEPKKTETEKNSQYIDSLSASMVKADNTLRNNFWNIALLSLGGFIAYKTFFEQKEKLEIEFPQQFRWGKNIRANLKNDWHFTQIQIIENDKK